jgi:micrococcal nuclease
MALLPNAQDPEGTVPITRVPTQEELASINPVRSGPAMARQAVGATHGGQRQPELSNGVATASLVVGIVSLFASLLFLPGIAAVALGVVGLRRMARTGLPVGRGMPIAGIVTGATSIVIGTAVASALVPAADAQIVVDRVIDGDTVDVARNGDTVRIRLLNIDTPETKDPNEPVECLGPEATEFLQAMLPPGTPVNLAYDVDRTDRYGRDLAGMFLDDGTFVNAEIARAGFGEAILFEPNDRFYPRVSAAEDEARAGGLGLFGTEVACTKAAAQAEAYQQSVSALLGKAPGSGAAPGKA